MSSYYESEDLKKFGDIGQHAKKLADDFFRYYGEVTGTDGALSKREKALIALAVSHAMKCPYCIDSPPLSIETLQVNITKLCNQVCRHCHVDASPSRTEKMSPEGIAQCLEILERHPQITNLDITGGAPELHPQFDSFVESAVALGRHVMVRHNLTVQLDGHPQTKESKEYLPQFFAQNRVEVVSSLPYYQEFFTDAQRGSGVFKKSMEAMKRLNDVGYGIEGSGLMLNLVYNPVGPYLPAPQAGLEADYKRELKAKFGLT